MTREAIAKAIWEAGRSERDTRDHLDAVWENMSERQQSPFYRAADFVLRLPSAEEEHL